MFCSERLESRCTADISVNGDTWATGSLTEGLPSPPPIVVALVTPPSSTISGPTAAVGTGVGAGTTPGTTPGTGTGMGAATGASEPASVDPTAELATDAPIWVDAAATMLAVTVEATSTTRSWLGTAPSSSTSLSRLYQG